MFINSLLYNHCYDMEMNIHNHIFCYTSEKSTKFIFCNVNNIYIRRIFYTVHF